MHVCPRWWPTPTCLSVVGENQNSARKPGDTYERIKKRPGSKKVTLSKVLEGTNFAQDERLGENVPCETTQLFEPCSGRWENKRSRQSICHGNVKRLSFPGLYNLGGEQL